MVGEHWNELSHEAQDAFVAEQVMNWKPGVECTGEIGEQEGNSSDGWICMQCGMTGSWVDDYDHEMRPPRYSTSLLAAWDIVERMLAKQEQEYYTQGFEWDGPRFKPSHHYLTHEGYPLGTTCWYVRLAQDGLISFMCGETPMEAICLAALRSVGIGVVK